jgi:hypothetical protein
LHLSQTTNERLHLCIARGPPHHQRVGWQLLRHSVEDRRDLRSVEAVLIGGLDESREDASIERTECSSNNSNMLCRHWQGVSSPWTAGTDDHQSIVVVSSCDILGLKVHRARVRRASRDYDDRLVPPVEQ